MDEAVSAPAGMLAISGLARLALERLTAGSVAQIAICNGPDQFVIGGLAPDLDRIAEAAASAGAARVARLAVNTPSHTALLASATAQFPDRIAPSCASRLKERVLSAVDGRRLATAEQAIAALARQLSTPLDWATCMDAVAEHQPDRVLEIGPGTALARLWASRFPAIPARAVDEFRSLDGVVDWLNGTQR
jgi:[acyl-carrier-protein] S-malonyltransferase